MKSKTDLAAVLAACAALAACGGSGGAREVDRAASLPAAATDASGISDTPVKLGDPFVIDGVTHTPVDVVDYDDVGYASWYGSEFAGRATANGESFNPAAFSAAHKTLPLPSYVEVTELTGGRTILVRVNDRGPMDNRRLIDLSEAAAKALGIADKPVPVRVRRVNPPGSERAQLRAGLPAAERLATPDSLLTVLRAKAAALPPQTSVPAVAVSAPKPVAPTPVRVEPAPAPAPAAAPPPKPAPVAVKPAPAAKPQAKPAPTTVTGSYVVQVAAFSTEARAKAAAAKVGGTVAPAGNLWRVRVGPFPDAAAAANALTAVKARGFGDARVVRDR
jgi:rare lipoprotein A